MNLFFQSLPGLFMNSLNCFDFCAQTVLLRCPPSPNGPGVLGVSLQGIFIIRNRSLLSAFELNLYLLT